MRTVDSILARVACLVALGSVGCGFSFYPQSLVRTREILAMKAEPPEVIVTGFDPMTQLPILSVDKVTISALVADPSDKGQDVPYVWRDCSETLSNFLGANGQWDAYEQRCLENNATLVAQGSEPLANYACDDPMTCSTPIVQISPFIALVNLITNGAGIDSLTGSSGGGATSSLQEIQGAFASGSSTPAFSLWLDTMLKVDNGSSAALYGIKRFVVSPNAPPSPNGMASCGMSRCPNQNPTLTGVLFDYKPWQAGTPLVLKAGDCPGNEQVSVPNPNGHGSVDVCQHTITPVFDPDQDEDYVVQTFTKQADGSYGTLSLKEYLRFQWYIDQGSLDNDYTSQPTNIGPQATDPVSTHWAEPPNPTSTTMNLWVITTDGRGGTSWDRRQVQFTK